MFETGATACIEIQSFTVQGSGLLWSCHRGNNKCQAVRAEGGLRTKQQQIQIPAALAVASALSSRGELLLLQLLARPSVLPATLRL